MSEINLQDYYNRYNPDKNYQQVLARGNRTLQSAELNEMQSIFQGQVRGVADALLRDGDIVRDCRVSVDASGLAYCEAGALYLNGAVHGVPPAEFYIPLDGTVAIGVYRTEKVITELEDPELYNPAIGTRGEGEPGASRLRVDVLWGYDGDGQVGEFVPVHSVDDGQLRAKEPPPNLDSVTQALARYDRDSAGGSYVVSGFNVLMGEDTEEGRQVYTVGEGRARVGGYAVELSTSRRLLRKASPDLLSIDSEPHISAGDAPQRITLDRYPVGNINEVRITRQSEASITHGGYTGASDPLPHTSVVEIVSVSQGGVVYSVGSDYKLSAGKVDWSPSGLEPSPNSTYNVVYHHITVESATDADLSGCTISGAVAGSQILISYSQMLPRIDRLCISREGEFVWVEGVAAEWNPLMPRVPEDMLPIAAIYQTWDGSRRVANNGVRTVPMDEIAAMNTRMDAIVEQVAQQRLKSDIYTREAGAKKGLFVDPCLNDEMRDQGLEQSAAIISGVITLPVSIDTISAFSNDITAPLAQDYTLQSALEQLLRTGSMKVNPYNAFDPLPALMELTPAVDRWTDVKTNWASAVTKEFNVTDDGYFHVVVGSQTSTSTETLSTSTSALAYLRRIAVAFKGTGFGINESVSVTFDGIDVTPAGLKAGSNGVLSGSFTIPANIPAGSKSVQFTGAGGTRGSAIFSGQGQLTIQTLRNVTTTVLTWHDPLAQTFVLNEACQLGGADLWFTSKGSSRVVVQIRETTVGMPNQVVLGEAVLQPGDIVLNNLPTRALFKAPVSLSPETEYALVVMCDDAETALAIAEIGKWDTVYSRWVTSQPYQVGVLLSSSNASTWTPHQDKDMAFRLLKTVYSNTSLSKSLGSVEVNSATDLIVYGISEQPSAYARAQYKLVLPDSSEFTVGDGQPVRLQTPISGPVNVEINLFGTSTFSPIVYPGAQLVSGVAAQSADYISRAMPAGADSRVRIIFNAYLPSGSGVMAAIGEDGASTWHNAVFEKSSPMDEGWQELVYEADTDALLVRVKLTLTGTSTSRPLVSDLRVLTL